MARNRRRRSKLNFIVIVLTSLLIAFSIISSMTEKQGLEVFDLSLPADLLQELLGDIPIDAPASQIQAEDRLSVHFIDVGQGKAILIKSFGSNVLIDAGESNKGHLVLEYLEKNGVSKLDYLVATHPHSDHIGGMQTIINNMEIGSILMPDLPDEIIPATQTFTDTLLAIAGKGLKITTVNAGDTYALKGGAKMKVIAPAAQYTNLNDMSIVIRLDYKGSSFLFTGDIESSAERDILESGADISADVLDAAHHGSSSSSTANFLNRVSPSYVVISCGIDNSYGHPHREVVERFEGLSAEVYRTDLDGNVVVYSDGNGYEIGIGN